jgi:hypothetical protein
VDQKLIEDDIRKTIPIMWAEIFAFVALTIGFIFYIGRAGPLLPGECPSASLAIPYIRAHTSEVCGNTRLVVAFSFYYVASLVTITTFQLYYFHKRRSIRRVSRSALGWILFLLGLTLFFAYNWLLGRDSIVISDVMAAFAFPGVQFIISSVLLERRNSGAHV